MISSCNAYVSPWLYIGFQIRPGLRRAPSSLWPPWSSFIIISYSLYPSEFPLKISSGHLFFNELCTSVLPPHLNSTYSWSIVRYHSQKNSFCLLNFHKNLVYGGVYSGITFLFCWHDYYLCKHYFFC